MQFSPALAPDGLPVNARVFRYSLIRLEIQILTDVSVGEARVVESPDPSLSERALHTDKTWKLKPATGPDGKQSLSTTIVEISFMRVG